MPSVGEALRLVWPGWYRPGHSGDVPQELCSDVPFLPVPMPPKSFSSTFRPMSSNEDHGNDNIPGSLNFPRFDTSSPTGSARGSSHNPSFISTPLPHGGAFRLVGDLKGMPSSAAGTPPGNKGVGGQGLFDEGLDMALEANNEADVDKEPTEDIGNELDIDPEEVQLLKQIIKPTAGSGPPTTPKSGDKRGSTHLDGGSGSSDSSCEDLDASRVTRANKKTSMPTKVSHLNQWSEDDIDIMHQIHYKMDLHCFQTYHTNKIYPADLASINTKDHSAYLEVARADPGSVIKKSVFSMAVYHATLKEQGDDTSKFNKEVGTNFKKGAKGFRAPDPEKVPIEQVMLVCQCENGVDIAYSDADGFGRPGTMGLWDLHSMNALSRAEMLL